MPLKSFGVSLLTVPHTYYFSESGTFWKVSLMYSSGVMVLIILVSTLKGVLLTPDFGTAKNLIKIASNREVLKVRKFRIVKRKNFDIWAIVIRSHL